MEGGRDDEERVGVWGEWVVRERDMINVGLAPTEQATKLILTRNYAPQKL